MARPVIPAIPEGFELEEQNSIPPIPEGFEIDSSTSVPPIPKGYVLDTQDEIPPIPEGFEIDQGPSLIDNVKRYGKGILAGAMTLPEGAARAVEAFSPLPHQKVIAKWIGDRAKVAREFYTPPDPKFADKVAAGFGSMASFMVPGVGIAKSVQAVSYAPKIASLVGASLSGVLEAMTEGGFSHERAKEKGMSEKDAVGAALKTFWLNLPTTVFTNRLGVFGDKGGRLRRAIASAPTESLQEFTQQVIGNISVNDPAFEGSGEAAAVGGIVGGGTSLLIGSPTRQELPEIPELKSTEDAIRFAHKNKNVPGIKEALKFKREAMIKEGHALDAAGKDEGLMKLQEAQLPREALEYIEGTLNIEKERLDAILKGEPSLTQEQINKIFSKKPGSKLKPAKNADALTESYERKHQSLSSLYDLLKLAEKSGNQSRIDEIQERIFKLQPTPEEEAAFWKKDVPPATFREKIKKYKTAEELYQANKAATTRRGDEESSVFIKPEFYDQGKPGYSDAVEVPSKERPLVHRLGKTRKSIVYRDEAGVPQGVVAFNVLPDGSLDTTENGNVEVYVNSKYRRKGVATKLYQRAKELGFDLDNISNRTFTKAGAEFTFSRLTREPVDPPIPPPPEGFEIDPGGEDPARRERGFITSVKTSPQVHQETKEAVKELPTESTTYEVYSDQAALDKARAEIQENPAKAVSDVLSSEEMTKDVTAKGIELMRQARERGDIETEVNIAETLARKGTEGGQFIQAFSLLDKLSADGVLVFASRQINRKRDTTKKISDAFAQRLKEQAEIVRQTPYGYQKVKETQKLMDMIEQERGHDWGDWLAELVNVPRTITAGLLDFSFGGRQGLFLLPTYSKQWAKAFKKQFGSFVSEKKYEAVMDAIMKHPDYEIAVKSGVSFTDIHTTLRRTEEPYMGIRLAEKIPIAGKGIIATGRAYTIMANKLRMDVFSAMLRDARLAGVDPTRKFMKQLAIFVNAATGRGPLGGPFKTAAAFLNGFFFSPRLMSSRLTLLNPAYYVTREPHLRKEALKSLFAFVGAGTTILTMAYLAGAEVELDCRSADFGKIRIGDTRIDIWGGFQQYMRMLCQQVTGEYVSTTTGKIKTLGEGYKPLTRYDILLRQVEMKEAPIFSLLTSVLKQQDWQGNKVNVPKEIGQRFVPMVIQDAYDLAALNPTLLPTGILAVFGFGVQTYTSERMKAIDEGIKRIEESKASLHSVARDIANKLHEDPTNQQIANVRKDILQRRARGDNPDIDRLMDAVTNDHKEEILREMRKKYSAQEMRKLESTAIKLKAVSSSVILKSKTK